MLTPRRLGLKTLGLAIAAMGTAAASPGDPVISNGARTLQELTRRLAAIPRRRDFKTVPMILDHRDLWDAAALDAVLQYTSGPKQSWDNTELGPWLTTMRNSMNNQIWSFNHPDFLCVSVTRGSPLCALYDDAMWAKYDLAKLTGGKLARNTLLKAPPAASSDPTDYQNPNGAFSADADSIESLQRRGAVFLACHNAIWGQSERLIATGSNPDKLSADALCADLSNHLVPGVVIIPGAVGTMVELASAGFSYIR